MSATTNDATTMPLTELRKRLEPMYRGISSIIRQLKDRKDAVPEELKDLQNECTALDRRINDLTDAPAVDAAGIDQEVDKLQARVGTATAKFKK